MAYIRAMLHAVAELPQFIRDANAAGLSDGERAAIIHMIAANPRKGDVIRGSGGLRKVRFGGRAKGKSGGYRVITAYFGAEIPVYVIAILSKRERENFTAEEIAGFRKLTGDIAEYHERKG
jgi:hypothetical protein